VTTKAGECTQVRTVEGHTAPGPISREELPVVAGDLLLGRYRVQELIAEGGQSLVYRVDDERLHRPACAKVFHVPGMAADSAAVVERSFVAEAFLLSGLCDPGTLQIYDFGYRPWRAAPRRRSRSANWSTTARCRRWSSTGGR
jgi:hypothetical protein